MAQDQELYQQKRGSLSASYTTLHAALKTVEKQICEQKAKHATLKHLMKTLDAQPELISEFNEALWHATVESATVVSVNELRFRFRDGTEMNVGI